MATDGHINLCFHGVGTPTRELETGEAAYWISEELFSAVLDLVRDVANVHLSFDDGNESDVAIALPRLSQNGLRATFFPIAGRLDQPGSLGRDDLRRLVAEGMTIGSHGKRHRPWRGMDDGELDEELVQARDVLSDAAAQPITTAACPLGSYDRRVLRRLRQLGYLKVYTSDRAAARGSWWVQPRFSLRSGDELAQVRDIVSMRGVGPATAAQRARMIAKRWR